MIVCLPCFRRLCLSDLRFLGLFGLFDNSSFGRILGVLVIVVILLSNLTDFLLAGALCDFVLGFSVSLFQ